MENGENNNDLFRGITLILAAIVLWGSGFMIGNSTKSSENECQITPYRAYRNGFWESTYKDTILSEQAFQDIWCEK